MSDTGNFSLPSRPADTPGLPANFQNIVWERFDTLNTKPPRPAIADTEFFWGDGVMPIGPSNLRLLWGVGSSSYEAPIGTTIVWFAFGNVASTRYGVVLLDDGKVEVFFTSTSGSSTIMPSGTILSPTSILGFSQWGSKYLIFSKDQENGYWLWDGTSLFTAGTVGPEVTLDSAGENYTSPPQITMQTTGAGTNAAFEATVENGFVSKITVTNPGSGFDVGDFAVMNVQGGGTDDQALIGDIAVSQGVGGLAEVYVIQGGNGYSSAAYARIDGTGGQGTNATISLAIQNGTVTGAAIETSGYNYIGATITVVDPGIPGQHITGGSGALLGCSVAYGQITSILVAYGGTGYVSLPTIKIVGDGSGAVAVPVISGGQVTSINMTNYGSGYTKALAVIQGGNNAANATPTLMPFGISGTAIEVYNDQVWVTNGAATATEPPPSRTLFSDPNSPVSFSNGGGSFLSTDSFVRVGYHAMKQTNGFLYLIGDSSLNLISGVKTNIPTSGTTGPPVTTFSNINVDPQFGSPWPASVQVFSRNIVFANTVGIFVSYGGAVTKASLPLDGFYASGPIFGDTANFSAAVAHIFGIPVYMLLLPVVDQISKQVINKLLMWDGKKWFTSQQDASLTFVATQEINSVLTAWGTDGNTVFPLFAKPSTNFTKVVQSKLYSSPAYWTTKTGRGLSGVVNSYAVDNPLIITIDNENSNIGPTSTQTVTVSTSIVSWVNDTDVTIGWTNNAGDAIWAGGVGLQVFGPYPMAQTGRMIGLTVTTSASDLAILSLNLSEMIESTNVF